MRTQIATGTVELASQGGGGRQRANRQPPGALPPQHAVASKMSSAPRFGSVPSQPESPPRGPSANTNEVWRAEVPGGSRAVTTSDVYSPTGAVETICRSLHRRRLRWRLRCQDFNCRHRQPSRIHLSGLFRQRTHRRKQKLDRGLWYQGHRCLRHCPDLRRFRSQASRDRCNPSYDRNLPPESYARGSVANSRSKASSAPTPAIAAAAGIASHTANGVTGCVVDVSTAASINGAVTSGTAATSIGEVGARTASIVDIRQITVSQPPPLPTSPPTIRGRGMPTVARLYAGVPPSISEAVLALEAWTQLAITSAQLPLPRASPATVARAPEGRDSGPSSVPEPSPSPPPSRTASLTSEESGKLRQEAREYCCMYVLLYVQDLGGPAGPSRQLP